ncbi:hypothetical protein BASA81_000452 [Batrachochytrium salamandrivorans]|nr:hypothetical protein BASA81_000452 [Batrachochytrium salamandrivorans]
MLPKNNPLAKSRANFKFDEDLKAFLFAFAGDLPAQKDTVELLNDICVDFIARTTAEAASFSRSRNQPVDVEALLHTQRHDARKHERILELQRSYAEINKLKFLFKEAETLAKKMPTALDSLAAQADKQQPPAKKVKLALPAGAAAGGGAGGGQPANKKKRAKDDHLTLLPHSNSNSGMPNNGVSILTASAASYRNSGVGGAPISMAAASAVAAAATQVPPKPAEPSQTEFLL